MNLSRLSFLKRLGLGLIAAPFAARAVVKSAAPTRSLQPVAPLAEQLRRLFPNGPVPLPVAGATRCSVRRLTVVERLNLNHARYMMDHSGMEPNTMILSPDMMQQLRDECACSQPQDISTEAREHSSSAPLDQSTIYSLSVIEDPTKHDWLSVEYRPY